MANDHPHFLSKKQYVRQLKSGGMRAFLTSRLSTYAFPPG